MEQSVLLFVRIDRSQARGIGMSRRSRGPGRATTAATALALAVGGLAACSNDESSGGTRTTSPRSTSSSGTTNASPSATVATPTAPVTFDPIPEPARQPTNTGAMAFARFWVDQTNKAFMTPVLGSVARLCEPAAPSCAAFEQQLSTLVEEKLRADGPFMEIKSVWIGTPEEPGVTSVVLDATIQSRNYVDAYGEVSGTEKGGHNPLVLNLVWVDTHWTIRSTRGRAMS